MSLLASPPVRRHCRDTYSEYARVGCSVMATVTRSRSPCTRRYARSPHLLTSALRRMTSSRDAWGETRRKFRRTANLLGSCSCTILSGYGTVGKAVPSQSHLMAPLRIRHGDTIRRYDTQAEAERIVRYAPHSVNCPIFLTLPAEMREILGSTWQPTPRLPEGPDRARSMFFAALWSRCRLVPQSGQECQRTDKSLGDDDPTPATGLRGVRGIDGYNLATGACCLVRQDDEERAPSRVTDAFRQMVILHHIGGL